MDPHQPHSGGPERPEPCQKGEQSSRVRGCKEAVNGVECIARQERKEQQQRVQGENKQMVGPGTLIWSVSEIEANP